MIRTVLELVARDGDVDAVVRYYREHRVLETSLEVTGCLATELHVPSDGGPTLLVTAAWESPEAYDRWLADPRRAATGSGLTVLLEADGTSVPPGRTYVLCHGAGRLPADPPADRPDRPTGQGAA